ncbi:SEC-C metal-binding domain-containing protein [Bacillus paramycoides]
MRTASLYAPCPCHSGKKYRFLGTSCAEVDGHRVVPTN